MCEACKIPGVEHVPNTGLAPWGKKSPGFSTTVPLPPGDKIALALQTLHDAELYLYQIFYFHGMASPGGVGPWRTRLSEPTAGNSTPTNGYQAVKHITGRGAINVGSSIQIWDSTPEGLLRKAVMWDDAFAKGKEKFSPRACCILAEPRSCVCEFSCSCPLHGGTCVGSHD